ncbi:hypothetical protein CJ030_MR0G019211 [Morella rubra]|uniref:Uncharacterized protein n=1 Tax=Morella rubra TaxID=262757 RepID=A0A6A1UGB3_9ROSI|nr:hypothetical protein CJ030_MR0G019211 [Morella rubra]
MEWIVVPIVEIIAKYAERVGQWLFDSFRHRSNIQNMKSEEETLQDAKSTVLHLTEAARRKGEEIEGAVQRWVRKQRMSEKFLKSK